ARPISRGETVSFSVRPEQMTIARAGPALPDESMFSADAQVLNRIFLGEHTEYLVREERLGEFLVLAPRQAEMRDQRFAVGDKVHVGWRQEAAVMLPTE
ncbi:MAG: TOBE domain-containing protein, partial [Rhizobiales bacterium]|nr:TOBE domain-containing protein [Hyphomicrobiales bacterium]